MLFVSVRVRSTSSPRSLLAAAVLLPFTAVAALLPLPFTAAAVVHCCCAVAALLPCRPAFTAAALFLLPVSRPLEPRTLLYRPSASGLFVLFSHCTHSLSEFTDTTRAHVAPCCTPQRDTQTMTSALLRHTPLPLVHNTTTQQHTRS